MSTIIPDTAYRLPDGALPCAALQKGTNLRRRYTLDHVVAADDCSVTYAGFDFKARQPVCVVEFYPRSLSLRAQESGTLYPRNKESGALYFLGSEAFLTQYGKLTQIIGSPHIISVFEAFFENGTAYAVTEPSEGVTLREYLDIKGRPLTPEELIYIGCALSDALLIVHSLSILHNAIESDRILICTDGTVKLTGFAAAHETIRRGHDTADMEPTDDILALGKTLYTALTDKPAPLDASTLAGAVPDRLSPLFSQMLSTQKAVQFASVFDLRYTISSTDITPARPALSAEEIAAYAERRRARLCAQHPTENKTAPVQPRAEAKHIKPDGAPSKRGARRLAIFLSLLILTLIAALVVVLTLR